MTRAILLIVLFLSQFAALTPSRAAGIGDVQIEWKVVNRFPFFRNEAAFKFHEIAWRQYLLHVSTQALGATDRQALANRTAVIGIEHVLNDRFIPFTRHARENYDWRGWAARLHNATCWNGAERNHTGCGPVENYLSPSSYAIDVQLRQLTPDPLFAEYTCDWRVNDTAPTSAPCTDPVRLDLPPRGGAIAVSVNGGPEISLDARVNDRLVVGLGDSFASGEGNPDKPAAISGTSRFHNIYPAREKSDASSNALWLDETCHRSLYGYQLRTALQMALEDPHASVKFLGYACSGASVEEGILGPQSYVLYESRTSGPGDPVITRQRGGKRDAQMAMLLAELCEAKPEQRKGLWTCPDNRFRRNIDYLLLSVGGNDIGFSNLIAWATLRDGASSVLAKIFGASMSAATVRGNIDTILSQAYARLARNIEMALPLRGEDLPFDASRVILSAYPDILTDERGGICSEAAGDATLNVHATWLAFLDSRIENAHDQLAGLHRRMGEAAGDLGWTFAARTYEDQPLRQHGFCARDPSRLTEVTEQVSIPCWGPKAGCALNWRGAEGQWRPFDPQTESFPYALRQRWVRTFNDVFLLMNDKVLDQSGHVDDRASASVFSETTGAMHPSAEGHAAMADAIMMDLRERLAANE
jgi:hypothetical protein